jgi:hypothetical protein
MERVTKFIQGSKGGQPARVLLSFSGLCAAEFAIAALHPRPNSKAFGVDTTLAASERAAYHAQKLCNPSSLKVITEEFNQSRTMVLCRKKAGQASPDRHVLYVIIADC